MTTLGQAIKNTTTTWNNDTTFKSSTDAVVDLFYKIGSMRNLPKQDIQSLVSAALNQDPYLTGKVLLWARDCRGGAGERRVFHVGMQVIDLEQAKKMIRKLAEVGTWKDVIEYAKYDATYGVAMNEIKQGFHTPEHQGLVCKWLPRKGELAAKIRAGLGMSPKQYRKALVNGSNTVEQNMCAKQWAEIKYEHVPSLAMKKYHKAFDRHDPTRFTAYKSAASKGEAKMNAGQLFPYDIVSQVPYSYGHYMTNHYPNVDRNLLNAQWRNLPDYMAGSKENIITVVDTSGSMISPVAGKVRAMDVAVSLGLYTAMNSEGIFKNKMITFNANPSWIELNTNDIFTAVQGVRKAPWGMNTDIRKTYQMILKAGVAHKVPESQMPTTILIVSDMQFDGCVSGRTALDDMRQAYADAGYKMPKVVFWNVNGGGRGVPAKADDLDVGLVSGFSPSNFKAILNGKDFTPRGIMLQTVHVPRYDY